MTFNTVPMHEAAGQTASFSALVESNVLTGAEMIKAAQAARARGIELEKVLLDDYRIPKHTILAALSEYYNCPWLEYDERLPIPPELLNGLDGEKLSLGCWFPIINDGGLVVILARDPHDPRMLADVKASVRAEKYEFRVALEEDIQWFIQDYLHAGPGALIGTERTGLAFWRNTMAHWRTRMACYRNDLASGRTALALLRWGLGLVALSDVLMRARPGGGAILLLYWLMAASGSVVGLFGLRGYLRIRRARMKTPGHYTLVEVTAATSQFLEDYHDPEVCDFRPQTRGTMLARLGDCIGGYSTILFPSPASKERTHLARERNVLAAQRTIAATHRTIYARARTGLAFIRTGVSFSTLGLGLLRYFGLSMLTIFDALLISAGLWMAVDGLLWYLPVRKEYEDVPRCELG